MAVTAKDVAEACGVSRITVNRALSGNENVKPETREKILKKAQEMGYVPNLIARSLVNGKSKMIGIVISDIKNLYFSEIVDAITRQARARGYMVCTCTHDSDCKEERRLIEMMKKDTELRLYVSSVVHRIFIRNWRRRYQDSWEQMIPSFILPALMPMAVCLRQS